MPTVRNFACSACCCAQAWSCGSDGDRYSCDSPCSAACRCGSPVPPNQTSVFGLARSALSCASASPEPLSDMLTLMPVVRVNTVWIMLHHSACTEQMTLSWPVSCAKPLSGAATRVATASVRAKCRVVMVGAPRAFLWVGVAGVHCHEPVTDRATGKTRAPVQPAAPALTSPAAPPIRRRPWATAGRSPRARWCAGPAPPAPRQT